MLVSTIRDLLSSIGPQESDFVLHQLKMVGEEDKSIISNFQIEQLLNPFATLLMGAKDILLKSSELIRIQ